MDHTDPLIAALAKRVANRIHPAPPEVANKGHMTNVVPRDDFDKWGAHTNYPKAELS